MNGLQIALTVTAAAVVIGAAISFFALYGVLCYIARRSQPKIFEKFAAGLVAKADSPEKYSVFEQEAARKEALLRSRPLERLQIVNRDGMKLVGRLYRSSVESEKYALLCHGRNSTGIGEFSFWSEYFHERGFNILLVDHRASGESEGLYSTYGLKESEDTLLWVDELNARFGNDIRILVFGISMGAATALIMSGKDTPDSVKAFAAESSYTSAWEEYAYVMRHNLGMPTFPVLHCVNALARLIAKFDFRKVSPIEAVRRTRKPVLFLHGGADDFVPLRMGEKLFDACSSENKEFHVVEGSVHARCYQTNPELCRRIFDEFSEKYL